MQEKNLDTQRSYNPFYAVRDAKMRSIANQSSYSQAKQVAAERMAMVLPMVYNHKGLYINYRQNFIAVKLSDPIVKNRKELKLLEADWEKAGVVKRHSEQGIIYRIPKK
jgi:hypothetical protein